MNAEPGLKINRRAFCRIAIDKKLGIPLANIWERLDARSNRYNVFKLKLIMLPATNHTLSLIMGAQWKPTRSQNELFRFSKKFSSSHLAPQDSAAIRLVFSLRNIFWTLIFSFIIACFSAFSLLIALPRDVRFSKMLWNSNLNVNFMNTRGEESGLRQNNFLNCARICCNYVKLYQTTSSQNTCTNALKLSALAIRSFNYISCGTLQAFNSMPLVMELHHEFPYKLFACRCKQNFHSTGDLRWINSSQLEMKA